MVEMEMSWLRVLLDNISSFLSLSSSDNVNSDPAQKYYTRGEEIAKLLKPVLEALVDSDAASNELLNNGFEELAQYVDELKELFESWQPLSSRLYSVLQIESLVSKIRESSMEVFQLLKHCKEHLPEELSSSSVEHCLEKIKKMGSEVISSTIEQALKDQRDGVGPTAEILVKITENLGLRSNQEILIEGVVLESMKENAELAEKNREAEFVDRLISLVTRMHDYLIKIKQSQTLSLVPVPPDFCCPLSLELMTDPVIVSSGQTYERVFIKKWMDMGLMVCPKTRQVLSHTTLIPNFTVKAFIANWCESNSVKPPNPLELIRSSQPFPLLVETGSGDSGGSHVILPHSGGNQLLLDDSLKSNSVNGQNSVLFNGFQSGGASSPSHPRSSSESSLSRIIRNGHDLNFATSRLNNAEDRTTSEDKNTGSPAREECLHATESEELLQGLSRSASAPGIVSDTVPRTSTGIAAAADAATSHREHSENSRGSRLQIQTTWRRPLERHVPGIIPATITETGSSSNVETEVRKLVEDLKSPSTDTQREAAARIRILARISTDNRIVIANCGAISSLVDLLHSKDVQIQANAVTALLNLSINDNNKSVIAEAGAIGPLIHVLKTGSMEARENSAATLFSLSVIEEKKIKIGQAGAIEPLVDLLGNGSLRGKKDAATALFNLSIHHENKGRIVQAGAVRHLVDLMDPAAGMVEKAVVVLANLATINEGKIAIGQEGGIPVLVEVVELGSARGKENAAAALLQLCMHSQRFCNTVIQEGAIPPLVALAQSGTARAQEKAQTLLRYFRNQRQGNHGRG